MAKRDPHFTMLGPVLVADLTRRGHWALMLCRLKAPATVLAECGYADWPRTWRGVLEGIACIDHPGFWGRSACFAEFDEAMRPGVHPTARRLVQSYLDAFGAEGHDCLVALAASKPPLERIAANIGRMLGDPRLMEYGLDVAEEEGTLS